MQKIGTVQSLWRYPVKGMAGESLVSARIGANGVEGDRLWAVQDKKRKEIQSCKFRPNLLQAQARCRVDHSGTLTGAVDITFPNGPTKGSDSAVVNEMISDLIGHASQLQVQLPLAGNEAFYRRYKADNHAWLDELKATFEREPGEPLPDLDNLPDIMQEYVSIPGTFFLVSPFHLLTTASLEHMRRINPEADWAVPRFRPNLVIETLPEFEGLVEQGWIEKKLKIGRAELLCSGAAPRCGAVTRAQPGLAADKSVLRSVVKHAEQNLGIYGDIAEAQVVNVGDEVFLLD